MINFLEFYIKKYSPKIDNKIFSKNERCLIWGVRFFSITSTITSFLLFSPIGIWIFSGLCSFASFQIVVYFNYVYTMISFNGLFDIFHYFSEIPKSFLVLVIYHTFIYDLSIINTFLISCNSIKKKVCELHGEDYIKKKHYNSTMATIIKAQQNSKIIAAAVAGGVIGGTISSIANNYVSTSAYERNYNTYTTTMKDNPELKVEAPKFGSSGFKLGLFKN
jgi:hypothetical protein